MTVHNRPLREPFGPQRQNIRLSKHFKHRITHHPDDESCTDDSQGDPWKNQRLPALRAHSREPAKLDGEQQQKQNSRPERRHRDSEQPNEPGREIYDTIPVYGGEYTKKNPYDQRH
ncbi:hypothetical protein D3C81_962150 [compost metagenome]